MSKFHNDPMVDKFEIVVLMGQILDVYGKRENSVQGTFFPPQTLFQISQRWVCSKLIFKSQVQIS